MCVYVCLCVFNLDQKKTSQNNWKVLNIFFNYIYTIPPAYVITTLTLIIEEIIVTIFILFNLLQNYEKQMEQKNRNSN